MMRIKLHLLPIFAIATALTLLHCTSRSSLPVSGPQTLNQTEQAGEKMYMEKCQRCHPQGEAGLGPAIQWVPDFAQRFQVRHGMGAMPAFDKDDISEKELDQLMAYLKAVD